MQYKNICIIVFLLLIHLQIKADESISISKINSLKPVVCVGLSKAELRLLHTQTLDNAGDFLSVYMVANNQRSTVALAGRYSLNGNHLSFTPMQTLGCNLVFDVLRKKAGKIVAQRRFNMPPHPLSEVQAIVVNGYPISDTIPLNTLFFHIRFSQTMMNDKYAYKYVKMYDADGNEYKNTWRQRSFWLDSGKLLVLMIHPGRVKNGIHYEQPLFELHNTYTLKVSKELKDLNGNAIATCYEQKYYIIDEDRKSPKVNFSKINIPDHGTRDELIVSFSEGMDNASVLEGVNIYDKEGNKIVCNIKEKYNDSLFAIRPDKPWRKGEYTLILKSSVCDFAANRINRLFEITDTKEMEKDKKNTMWQFEIY